MNDLKRKVLKIDGENIVCEYKLANKNAVIIHGGGASTQLKKYYPVAEVLASRGVGTVLFDFSGHGQSTGQLGQLSLERRKRQAAGVIDAFISQDSIFYLIGFSMGAHTVCDLLPRYGSRVKSILLGCPAIYRADVQNMPFGTDMFTAKLREPNSWRTTKATEYLSYFKGKTVIGIGDNDEVIPDGVINMLKGAAKDLNCIELTGATHSLMTWLPQHPDKLTGLIDALVEGT